MIYLQFIALKVRVYFLHTQFVWVRWCKYCEFRRQGVEIVPGLRECLSTPPYKWLLRFKGVEWTLDGKVYRIIDEGAA